MLTRIGLLAAALAAAPPPPLAGPPGIPPRATFPAGGGYASLTLPELARASSGVFVGRVAGARVWSIDPGDGAPLFITTLELEGRRVGGDGDPTRMLVRFPGGFTDEETGTFNSTAPPRHAVREGRGVVVFYEHAANGLGAGPGYVLVGGRAGLFTTFRARDGRTIVQGRSDSVALPHNRTLADLENSVRALIEQEPSGGGTDR